VADPVLIDLSSILAGGFGTGATGLGGYLVLKKLGWLGNSNGNGNSNMYDYAIKEKQDAMISMLRSAHERDERMVDLLSAIDRNIAVLVDRKDRT